MRNEVLEEYIAVREIPGGIKEYKLTEKGRVALDGLKGVDAE